VELIQEIGRQSSPATQRRRCTCFSSCPWHYKGGTCSQPASMLQSVITHLCLISLTLQPLHMSMWFSDDRSVVVGVPHMLILRGRSSVTKLMIQRHRFALVLVVTPASCPTLVLLAMVSCLVCQLTLLQPVRLMCIHMVSALLS